MKNPFSFNTCCVSNLYMLKLLRTCKSKGYLKALLTIIEKGLFVSRRKLDCLKLFIYKGIHLRKIKERVKSRGYQIKEKTVPNDLTNKHEVYFKMLSAFKVMNTCLWYLDSGCSRHMTGATLYSKNLNPRKMEMLPLEMEANPR